MFNLSDSLTLFSSDPNWAQVGVGLLSVLLLVCVSILQLWLLYKQKKIQDLQARCGMQALELTQKQIELQMDTLKQSNKNHGKANLDAKIVEKGKMHSLEIINLGPAKANNIAVKIDDQPSLSCGNLIDKNLSTNLDPGDTTASRMVFCTGDNISPRVLMTWTNEDGTAGCKVKIVNAW